MTDTPNTTQGKGAVDWDRPIEAVHEDGRIVAVTHLEPGSVRAEWSIRPKVDTWHHIFMDDGRSVSPVSGWRIRNVPEHPTPTQYAPELVERMVALVRDMVDATNHPKTVWPSLSSTDHYLEARSILSDLPQEVDPDEQEASDLVKKLSREGFIFGNTDQAESVAVAGIKRGRQLQQGEVK